MLIGTAAIIYNLIKLITIKNLTNEIKSDSITNSTISYGNLTSDNGTYTNLTSSIANNSNISITPIIFTQIYNFFIKYINFILNKNLNYHEGLSKSIRGNILNITSTIISIFTIYSCTEQYQKHNPQNILKAYQSKQ